MTRVCITIDTEGDAPLNRNSTHLGTKTILPSLLRLFARNNIKATFFVQQDEICQVGTIFSELWKSLQNEGHEIGHHAHGLVRASLDEKENIITTGIHKLRELGFNPVSFRGGCFHFNSQILRILEKNKMEFDSSVVPGLCETFTDGTLRCDHIGTPRKPYFPSYSDHKVEGESMILELPINRYPKFPAHRWGGVLTGSEKDEVLFDYFFEIVKDELIIINVHLWQGLSLVVKNLAHKKDYGKTRKIFLQYLYKIAGSDFLTNGSYLNRFNHLLNYISAKNDVIFATIKEAGAEIKKHTG